MINTNVFEQILKDVSAEDLHALMRIMGEPFDSFANALAKGSIRNWRRLLGTISLSKEAFWSTMKNSF